MTKADDARPYTLGHVSDWHATSPNSAPLTGFLNKRFFGWLSWNVSRKHHYQPAVLSALFDDLAEQAPDHLVVTGDLTNVGLAHEFVETASLLEGLGPPEGISIIPGNHDAYVASPPDRSWDLWADYLCGDRQRPADVAPTPGDYPVVWERAWERSRERGSLAIVGLCSAHPTALFQASGRLGAVQLERLGELLRTLGEAGRFRVLLVHHPPVHEGMSPRRRLLDAEALQRVVAEHGAELVLHGHRHRSVASSIAGPAGPVPVVGVCSSSYGGPNPQKRARYHLYRIARRGDGFDLRVDTRVWEPGAQRFVESDPLPLPGNGAS